MKKLVLIDFKEVITLLNETYYLCHEEGEELEAYERLKNYLLNLIKNM